MVTSTPNLGCPPQCGAAGQGLPLLDPQGSDQSSITDVWEHTQDISPTRAISNILLLPPRVAQKGQGPSWGLGLSSGPAPPGSWVLWPMLNDQLRFKQPGSARALPGSWQLLLWRRGCWGGLLVSFNVFLPSLCYNLLINLMRQRREEASGKVALNGAIGTGTEAGWFITPALC